MNSSNAAEKCACSTCQCRVKPESAILREGKRYCSQVCAYDCTATTCVCVHDHCMRIVGSMQ